MALLTVVPDTVALELDYNATEGITSGFSKKLVPKNIDGTIFDCTGYTVGVLYVSTPLLAKPLHAGVGTIYLSGGDATGITVYITEVNAKALAEMVQTRASTFSIVLGNSIDEIIAAKGSLVVILLP